MWLRRDLSIEGMSYELEDEYGRSIATKIIPYDDDISMGDKQYKHFFRTVIRTWIREQERITRRRYVGRIWRRPSLGKPQMAS